MNNKAIKTTLNMVMIVGAWLTVGTAQAQETVQYGYDAQGRLSTVTQADSTVKTYLYENASFPHALTGVLDENNSRFSTWLYDTQGRAYRTYEAGNAGDHTLVYNTDGSVQVTDALGAVRTFTFGRVGDRNLVSGISGSQCPTCSEGKATTYNDYGWVSSRTDYNNVVTTYLYDNARGLETSRTEASGTPRARTITTAWHATYRLPTQIDEPGLRTTFTHDPNGNVLTKTLLDTTLGTSRTWTYTYNGFGQVLTADGPRTDVTDRTTYTYYTCTTGYQCGQVHTVTNALSQVITFLTYTTHGQPLTFTDQNNVLTTLAYDARQRLISRTVGTETTTFTYWPTGLLKKVTLPDLSYIEYGYDAAHRLTQVQDSEGNRIAYTLDLAGNRTAENIYDPSNALTQTRRQVFNSLSQLYQTIGAANTAAVTTTFGYDNNGNQTTTNAPLSRNATNGYDELNRLTQVTDPANGITSYGYNALDQLISVTDPRVKTTTYTYNGLGDLLTQVSPDTGTTTNTYDSGGNLATSTDARSKVATHSYDALNRLTQIAYTGGQTKTFTYDQGTNGVGRVTTLTNSLGNVGLALTYTDQGRIASKTQTGGGVSTTVTYGYNGAGQLSTLTTPSGQVLTYTYTQGHLTGIQLNGNPILTNVLYEPFGPVRQWTWGNGTFVNRTYDDDGKLTQIDSAGLNEYEFDDAFRITAILDANPNRTWRATYDVLDRVKSSSNDNWLYNFWDYDANGNRITQFGAAATAYTVDSASNRLTETTGSIQRSYQYDAAGNTLSDGGRSFAYGADGRMTTATPYGFSTFYRYNALGQRVRKNDGFNNTHFVYDEAGHLLGEYDTTGALVEEIVWMNDIPVATIRPNGGSIGFFYVHTDHLNAPTKLTRPTDNVVVWRWNHDAFGVGLSNPDPDGNGQQVIFNLRFPGQYYDSETGLHYNYFRDYDPKTGRYVQSDPIGLDGGLNTYTYVGNNPISNVDPKGEILVNVAAGVVSGLFSGAVNVLTNASNECVPAWKHFVAGFAGGFVGGFTLNPVTGGALAGAITSGLNSRNSGGSREDQARSVIIGGGVGAVAGMFGGYVGGFSDPFTAGAASVALGDAAGGLATQGMGVGCQCP